LIAELRLIGGKAGDLGEKGACWPHQVRPHLDLAGDVQVPPQEVHVAAVRPLQLLPQRLDDVNRIYTCYACAEVPTATLEIGVSIGSWGGSSAGQ